MSKFSQISLISVVGVLLFCGCHGQSEIAPASSGPVQWLVADEQIKDIELKIVWQNKFPFDNFDSLKQLELAGDRVYGFSESNYLVSLNRQNGSAVFIQDVAPSGLPIFGISEYNGMLYSLLGNRLVELNLDSGVEISSTRLDFSGTCAATRNSRNYFIAGRDNRIHTLLASNKIQVYEVAAPSDTEITSIIALENLLLFSSLAGEVMCIHSNGKKVKWRFDAGGGIVGKMSIDKNSLYFASNDTKVYKISGEKGKLVWLYPTDGILERGPRVTKAIVYQYVRGKGLIAIDKDTGSEIWTLADGLDLLSEYGDKAYVLAEGSKIILMDNGKGEKLGEATIAEASKYAVNFADSKIYVGGKDGRIACLEPKY